MHGENNILFFMECHGLLNEIGYKTLIMSHHSNSSTSLLYGETKQ